MKKIFKYQIPFEHQYFDLALPKGSRILTLQLQDGIPYLWTLVDPNKEVTARHFRLFLTGENIFELL